MSKRRKCNIVEEQPITALDNVLRRYILAALVNIVTMYALPSIRVIFANGTCLFWTNIQAITTIEGKWMQAHWSDVPLTFLHDPEISKWFQSHGYHRNIKQVCVHSPALSQAAICKIAHEVDANSHAHDLPLNYIYHTLKPMAGTDVFFFTCRKNLSSDIEWKWNGIELIAVSPKTYTTNVRFAFPTQHFMA